MDPVLGVMLRPGELVGAELVIADDWPDLSVEDWAFAGGPMIRTPCGLVTSRDRSTS